MLRNILSEGLSLPFINGVPLLRHNLDGVLQAQLCPFRVGETVWGLREVGRAVSNCFLDFRSWY